jgi:hypothetical protein
MKKALLVVALILCAGVLMAQDPKMSTELQALTGTLKELTKSELKYSLQLDGMTGSMNVTGDSLKDFKAGDRVMVKGVIKTRLVNPKPDGTPQQQPAHWTIFMEVREIKVIKSLFGLTEKE